MFQYQSYSNSLLVPLTYNLIRNSLAILPQKHSYQKSRCYFVDRIFSPAKSSIKKVVPYTPEEYFDLVIDVENYQNFLPWCLKSSILNNKNFGQDKFAAELSVGFKFFKEKYTSVIKYRRPEYIQVSAADSTIFSKLLTEWNFSPGPTNNTTYLEFSLDFQLINSFHHQTLGFFLNEMAETMTTSFENRAAFLYGDKKKLPREIPKIDTIMPSNNSRTITLNTLQAETTTNLSEEANLNFENHPLPTDKIQEESNLDLKLTEWSKIFKSIMELEKLKLLTKEEAFLLKRLARRQNKELAIIFLAFEKHPGSLEVSQNNTSSFIESLKDLVTDIKQKL